VPVPKRGVLENHWVLKDDTEVSAFYPIFLGFRPEIWIAETQLVFNMQPSDGGEYRPQRPSFVTRRCSEAQPGSPRPVWQGPPCSEGTFTLVVQGPHDFWLI
jgi:hypothetical protein